MHLVIPAEHIDQSVLDKGNNSKKYFAEDINKGTSLPPILYSALYPGNFRHSSRDREFLPIMIHKQCDCNPDVTNIYPISVVLR